MKNRIFGFIMLAVILSWITIACQMDEQIVDETSSTDVGQETASISLSQSSLTLTSGGTAQLSIVSDDVSASGEATWTSSDNAVAQVDQTGLVTALSAGSSTITVTANGVSATCLLTVTNSEITALAVSISPTSVTLSAVGAKAQLTADISPTDATNVTYTWTSGDTSIATVSQSGLVTAVAAGTTSVTVKTNNGLTASATITVSATASTTSTTSSTVTTYTVSSSSCTGCGNCRSVCPSGAITISGRKATIDQTKCTACGKCYSRCGHGAIVKTVTSNITSATTN